MDPAFRVTSPETTSYNCIAWAAGDTDNWWCPRRFWPAGVPSEVTLEAFEKAFETVGYARCVNGALESGVEKIALFTNAGRPSHAARQLVDGDWTSKVGQAEDISHALTSLEGAAYGSVALFMSRQRAF